VTVRICFLILCNLVEIYIISTNYMESSKKAVSQPRTVCCLLKVPASPSSEYLY
jgi:hypothetical protein